MTQTNGKSIWTCPNRLGYPQYSAANSQYVVGYQYYGGFTTWKNNLGTFAAASPVKTTLSKPSWMLAADLVAQQGGITSDNWHLLVRCPLTKTVALCPLVGMKFLLMVRPVGSKQKP